MISKPKTRVYAIICPKCSDIIYSRANHDFHWCTCKSTFIDGGFEYIRMGGSCPAKVKSITKYIPATKEELYNDWNTSINQYGWIKPKRTEEQLRRLTNGKRKKV
jgi:hypothetical protein